MGKYCPVSCKGVVKKVLESNPTDKNCNDLHPRCPIWKDLGECQENPQDMNRFCRLSCGKCEDEAAPEEFLCTDRNETCAFWVRCLSIICVCWKEGNLTCDWLGVLLFSTKSKQTHLNILISNKQTNYNPG